MCTDDINPLQVPIEPYIIIIDPYKCQQTSKSDKILFASVIKLVYHHYKPVEVPLEV
jgi:hypothetical protein